MLLRNPRFIAKRTPRYVPPPSILVPAIEHVYDMFRNTVDLKTGVPIFTAQFQAKADAVLQMWRCICGTNKVEGGPHSDIYWKFGALHGYVLLLSFRN